MKLLDIKGIGKKKKELLESLGIYDGKDLYTFLPRRYEDRSKKVELADAIPGIKHYFELKINDKSRTYFYGRNKSVTRLKAFDESGQTSLVWYNDRFSARNLVIGQVYKVYGSYDPDKKAIINPVVASLDDDRIGGISPIYSSVKGLSQKDIIKYKDYIIGNNFSLKEFLDEEFLAKKNIQEINIMYRNLHKPETNLNLYNAFYSYYFRKIYLDKLANKIYRKSISSKAIKFEKVDLSPILNMLSFSLTKSQDLAIKEILADMRSDKRMNRIIIGDVGSGKTIVAIIAAYLAIKNNYQVAFMAPTEILAIQHYNKYRDFLNKLGIQSYLLIGSTSLDEKKEIYEKIKSDQASIVFGTHALFQDRVEFSNLGLVITDEQQRFGVNQRKRLSDKGYYPDILLMSATPIPRTLALSLYDNLDLSYMEDLPSDRLEIKSYLTSIYKEKDFIDFAYNQILQGRQVYLVVSRVKDDGEDQLESVERLYKKLSKYFKGKINIDILHGEMDSSTKEEKQRQFASGSIDMLIATSIIEVGIDVPNANTMIIYDANQFGLSQLHQIRGRVGRSNIQSYCFFVSSEKEIKNEKLIFISQNNDGFEIAKKDLEIRGQGQIYGTNQSGFIELDSSFLYNQSLINLANDLVKNTGEIRGQLKVLVDEKLKRYEDIILN